MAKCGHRQAVTLCLSLSGPVKSKGEKENLLIEYSLPAMG